MPKRDAASPWTLSWSQGRLEVQALGGMLGPVHLQRPDGRLVQPMYRAPWHGETGPSLDDHPMLRHLNGEWLCVPFGPARTPALPDGWRPRIDDGADAGFDHGWPANHPWTLIERDEHALRIELTPPPTHVLARIERHLAAMPQAPHVVVTTTLHPRRSTVLPAALHPTFALPPEGIELLPGHYRAVHAYPVPPEPGRSLVVPGSQADSLAALPTTDGRGLDLHRFPLPADTEELLQLQDCAPPFALRLADGTRLEMDWSAEHLPDVMLWISHRGRHGPPWSGRNLALGIEPCASCFDLTRVADPPPEHPLAHGRGLVLEAGVPLTLRWSLRLLS